MRYLLLLLVSVFALNTPAAAQTCCPAGCVADVSRCVYTGTNRTCRSIPCAGGGFVSPSPGRPGRGIPMPSPPAPQCQKTYNGRAQLDYYTDQCVADLTTHAQFWGCLFEDDASRAENLRTGLSCFQRQAALAQQCRARCATYVDSLYNCDNRTARWQEAFGEEVGGVTYGIASVGRCGPRLKSNPRARLLNPYVRSPPIAQPFVPYTRRPPNP